MSLLVLKRRWQSMSPKRRLWLELTALAGLLGVATPVFRITVGWDLLAPVKGMYRAAYAHIYFPMQARHDPSLGEVLTLPPQAQVVQGQLKPTAYKGIIFCGYPSPCALKSLAMYQVVQKAYPSLQVVLVFAASEAVVRQTAQANADARFVWVADEQRHYAQQLNAYYFPRVYLVDSAGRLRYIQHYRTGSQRALMEAVELLREEVR